MAEAIGINCITVLDWRLRRRYNRSMNVIVAGTRTITDWKPVLRAIYAAREEGIRIDTLVCGMADGVDETAYYMAKVLRIPIIEKPADWTGKGRAAGPIRNSEMASIADALIAIWDGHSPGTEDMIEKMKALGKPVHVRIHRESSDA